MSEELRIGNVTIRPKVRDGCLASIGDIRIGEQRIRNPDASFLPWFDSYEGEIFNRFELIDIRQRDAGMVIRTRALSDPESMFQERRDASGDIVLRPVIWGGPSREAGLDIVLEPTQADVDGRHFTGFRYWFEFAGGDLKIHRLMDRQTWEIGGDLRDVSIVCRNLFDLPRKRITREGAYSTVGIQKQATLLPGSLWARWSLLPAFDMQYGTSGVMAAWFDHVSCIRSVIESMPGEDWIRHVDIHYFENSASITTNPKTIVCCMDALSDVDALNLWTRLHEQESRKARRQFGMRQELPPAIVFSQNLWRGFRFESSYRTVIEAAAEFGADYVFIDPVWEHGEALRETLEDLLPPEKRKGTILEKYQHANMCCTYDFEVAAVHGGETGLKRLIEESARKGVRILSWMSMHYHPHTVLQEDAELRKGSSSIFASKESGRHPDTGYPGHCWTANLNGPIYDKILDQIRSVCRRTGLAGFLWDSFSNLGWWQVDYGSSTMRPQFDKVCSIYAELANDGLYLMPEAITGFSNHSCCGLHGGNVYADDLLGYSYNTNIAIEYPSDDSSISRDRTLDILRGRQPLDLLFQCIAHKRVPTFAFHRVPRSEWSSKHVHLIQRLFANYRTNRDRMVKRTVLKNGDGVLWENDANEPLFFCFRPHERNGRSFEANSVYRL